MAAIADGSAEENESSVYVPCPPPPPVIDISHQNDPRNSTKTVSNSLSLQIKDLNAQCRNIIATADVEHKNCRWLVHNTEVKPKLQRGRPMCGLVALNMAVNILKLRKCTSPSMNSCSGKISHSGSDDLVGDVDGLLALARNRGFSEQGEMYCAENLAMLAKEYYGVQACVQYKGLDEHENVLNHLVKGLPILVPYDADKNHQPCQARGHSAHWAVVTGFLGCFEDESVFSNWTRYEVDAIVPNLYHKKDTTCFSENVAKYPLDKIKTKHLYLLARQGKSQHIGVWSFMSLKESNFNLAEIDPKKENTLQNFIVPKGGLKKGLFAKIIYIS